MLEQIREYCLQKPGVTEDMKWGDHLVFSVGLKMFAIFGLDQIPINASIKIDPEKFEERCQEDRFYPAPYLARDTWVGTSDLENLTWNEWKTFLDEAYQLKFNRLPKKLQIQLLEAGNR